MKILVSDYDDTFFLNEEDIEKNKKAVQTFREKGNLFVIATGRSFKDIKEEIIKYNLKFDYLIINHGATILNQKEEILFNFSMPNIICQNLKEVLLNKHPEIKLLNDNSESEENIYFCCSKLESRLSFMHQELTKIAVCYEKGNGVSYLNDLINKKFPVHSYLVSENMIEIISKNTNKAKAIEKIANIYDVNDKNIFVIGNGHSDIEMIKSFQGYAMKNSVKEVEQVAIDKVKSVSELVSKILI